MAIKSRRDSIPTLGSKVALSCLKSRAFNFSKRINFKNLLKKASIPDQITLSFQNVFTEFLATSCRLRRSKSYSLSQGLVLSSVEKEFNLLEIESIFSLVS